MRPKSSSPFHLARLSLLIALLAVAGLARISSARAGFAIFKNGYATPVVGGTYAGTEDTMLVINHVQGYPPGQTADNFGARTDFEVGAPYVASAVDYRRHVLIRFDITALNGQIAAVNSVTLRLYPYDRTSSDTIQVYQLAQANAGWIEGTGVTADSITDTGMSTWQQRVQGSANWAGSAGASTAGTDYLTPLIASKSFDGSTPMNSAFDLTFTDVSMVQGWAAGNNPGLFLRAAVESSRLLTFRSSDYTADASYRPELIIDYTPVPEPAACGSAAGALLCALAVWRVRRGRP